MNSETFEKLMTDLEGLTPEQRQQVSERVKTLNERADSARLIGAYAESSTMPSADARRWSG